MRLESVVNRTGVFVPAAVVAAHATAGQDFFRQRDVLFLIELFCNWVDPLSRSRSDSVQATQIARYLSSLVRDGYAQRRSRGRSPVYRLTRIGLIELLVRLTDKSRHQTREDFLFLAHFISAYRSRVEELVRAEGRLFPASLKVELDALLNVQELIAEEIRETERELRRIETRAREAKASGALAERLSREGRSTADVVKHIEEDYPYELNSLKPLSELINSIPPHWRLQEISTGSLQRAAIIWEPLGDILKHYLLVLKKLPGNI